MIESIIQNINVEGYHLRYDGSFIGVGRTFHMITDIDPCYEPSSFSISSEGDLYLNILKALSEKRTNFGEIQKNK